MKDVTITGLEIVREPRLTAAGHSILAHFSADVGVFHVRGCVLVRTARKGLAAWLPRLDDPRAHRNRSVSLNDEPTRNALLQRALQMYRRMGGTEGEYLASYDGADNDVLAADPQPVTRTAIEVTRRVKEPS